MYSVACKTTKSIKKRERRGTGEAEIEANKENIYTEIKADTMNRRENVVCLKCIVPRHTTPCRAANELLTMAEFHCMCVYACSLFAKILLAAFSLTLSLSLLLARSPVI